MEQASGELQGGVAGTLGWRRMATQRQRDAAREFRQRIQKHLDKLHKPRLPTGASEARRRVQGRAKLQALYGIGKEADKAAGKLAGGNSKHGQQAMTRLAEAIGRAPSWLYSAARFATRVSADERNELYEHAEYIGLGHVFRLVRIKDPSERRRMVREVVRNSWSPRELGREVTDRYATRRGGGRPHKQLKAAMALLALSEAASRLDNLVSETVAQCDVPSPPALLRERAKVVARRLEKLSVQLDEAAGKLRNVARRARRKK